MGGRGVSWVRGTRGVMMSDMKGRWWEMVREGEEI